MDSTESVQFVIVNVVHANLAPSAWRYWSANCANYYPGHAAEAPTERSWPNQPVNLHPGRFLLLFVGEVKITHAASYRFCLELMESSWARKALAFISRKIRIN